MGKNSLLKSTSEKTDEELKAKTKKRKPKAKAKPKPKAKPKAKAKAKAAARVKKAVKAKAVPKAKAAVKAKPKAKAPAKKAAPAKRKAVSIKDLVQKKFDTWKPDKVFTVSPEEKDLRNFSAPPFVSGTEEETQRIKSLLLKKYDMAEIRAAAQKAVEEKAAAEKSPDEPEVSVSYGPPDDGEPGLSDPMDNVMKYMVAAFVILVVLIIGTSVLNHSKYYVNYTDGALEVWQGRFSPMGEKLLITLPGVQPPETIKSVYSKVEAYPFIFDYYLGKADTLLEMPGMPDFEGIQSYLNKALPYATTNESTEAVYARLDSIELMILLYKAEVSASRATIADLEKAKEYLDEAARLDIDDLQSDLVYQKIESVKENMKALKEKEAEVAVEKAPEVESTPTH